MEYDIKQLDVLHSNNLKISPAVPFKVHCDRYIPKEFITNVLVIITSVKEK